TLTQGEVGTQITVVVSYTDGGGTGESLSSAEVGPVVNINDAPVGLPTIVGTPTQGQILSANTAGISDADGLGTFSYQWQAGGADIVGANAASYSLTQSEVGSSITVTVSYTDAGGTGESLTSAEVGPVANTNDAPVGLLIIEGTPSQGETLSVNTTGISDADGLGAFSYQWQADGADIAGANEASYTLTQNEVGSQITVIVSYTDSGGTSESLTSAEVGPVTNINDAPVGTPVINGTASQGNTLTVDTTAISDADGVGTFSYQWQSDGADIAGATGASYELTQNEVGSSITVTVSYTDGGGINESLTSTAVGPVVNVNDAPEGIPTIVGTPTQGQILTTNTAGISDADGLGTLHYEWRADGVAISGAADGYSYTLT
ncbi:MAG: hemolysin, partial [Gammaproteobacteria bacterium]|nr:hemolysin [Gammaproteobacteria bacterium]